MPLRRSSARVLPVDRAGRVLLQLAHGLLPRGDRRWLSIGGGLEPGETVAEAAAREMREESGIAVDPAALGRPLGTTVIRYTAFGVLPVIEYLGLGVLVVGVVWWFVSLRAKSRPDHAPTGAVPIESE